jgi:hypothetical protein
MRKFADIQDSVRVGVAKSVFSLKPGQLQYIYIVF